MSVFRKLPLAQPALAARPRQALLSAQCWPASARTWRGLTLTLTLSLLQPLQHRHTQPGIIKYYNKKYLNAYVCIPSMNQCKAFLISEGVINMTLSLFLSSSRVQSLQKSGV